MRILVLWADDMSANLGVRVLASGAAEVARQAWGRNVDVDFQDFASTSLGTTLNRRSLVTERRVIKRSLRNYDLILDTGAGDSFSDIYGMERIAVMAETQRMVRREGIPLILLPQTFGPFETKAGRWLARRTLRGAMSTMTRDSESTSYSNRVLDHEVSHTGTDLVFALPPALAEGNEADVLINPSGLLWASDGHVDSRAYRNLITDLIEALIGRGREVKLLAHVLDNPSADNDLVAINDLRDRFPSVASLVPGSLAEARSMLGAANVVIASRMHACLNALSLGTAALPLAYSRKFSPLLSDLGFDDVLDLRSHVSLETVLATLARVEQDNAAPQVAAAGRARLAGAVAKLRELHV